MLKIILTLIFIVSVIFPIHIRAASVTLSNPSTDKIADLDTEFEVDVDLIINSSDNTKYYLRGIFYKSGTNKYCGFTWNGITWYNGPYGTGEGWKNLPSVIVSSESGQIRLKAKLDFADDNCNKAGEYNFKIQRYTQGGSASFDDQNEVKLTVDVSLSTSTPIPTSTKTPQSPTSHVKTKSSEPTIKKQVTAAIIYTPTVSPEAILISAETLSADILDSESTKSQDLILSTDSKSTIAGIMEKKAPNLLKFLQIAGISFIFLASFISFKKVKSLKN